MYLTGFADEASQNLGVQIQVTQALGWNAIEARGIWGPTFMIWRKTISTMPAAC